MGKTHTGGCIQQGNGPAIYQIYMNLGKFVKSREEKFGAAIFDTLKEKVYVTNTCGRRILSLVKEGKDKNDIIKTLKQEFDAPDEVITADVAEFLNSLKDNNLT